MIAIMKKVKRENSSESSETATWYSSLLFSPNENPLKFYLKGYNRIEFSSMRKIIEAYGGELSEPTGDTIIFTEQDRPEGIRQCYHTKYLHDCIMENKLLDLEEYKLPLDKKSEKVKEESTSHEQMIEKSEEKSIRKEKNDCHKSGEFKKLNTQNRKRSYGFYSEEEDRKIMDYVIRNNLIARTGSMYVWTKIAAENVVERTPFSLLDHFKRKLVYEYEQYTDDPAAREEFKKLMKKRGKSTGGRYEPSQRPHRCSKWSDEENQILMDYIVEHNLIKGMKGRNVSCEIIKKAGLKHERSVYSVQSQICKLSHWGYEKYITDPKALREFAALQGK